MKDLLDRRKVKNIAKEKRNFQKKLIETKPDSLSMLNQIGRQKQNYNYDIALSTNNLRLFEQ